MEKNSIFVVGWLTLPRLMEYVPGQFLFFLRAPLPINFQIYMLYVFLKFQFSPLIRSLYYSSSLFWVVCQIKMLI